MPLFGLLPYDDDEERRRRFALPEIAPPSRMPLRTPPMIPARMPGAMESSLPEVPTPDIGLPTPAGIPGGTYGPPVRRPTRGQQISEARDVYLQGAPGRGKSALTGALEALGRGEGLIGAAAGGLTGAINPRRLREQQFEQRVRPRIMEGFAFEDQAAAQQRQAEQDALNAEYRRAQIGELGRRSQPRPAPPQRPIIVPPGGTAIDPTTRQPIFTAPERIKPPTQAELGVDPESGLSYEEMADASYQARGGDDYVLSKMPARVRQILIEGTVTEEGKVDKKGNVIPGKITRPADPEEVEVALSSYESAIKRQRATDLQYSRGAIRGKRVGGRQKAAPKGRPGRNAISVKEAADLLK